MASQFSTSVQTSQCSPPNQPSNPVLSTAAIQTSFTESTSENNGDAADRIAFNLKSNSDKNQQDNTNKDPMVCVGNSMGDAVGHNRREVCGNLPKLRRHVDNRICNSYQDHIQRASSSKDKPCLRKRERGSPTTSPPFARAQRLCKEWLSSRSSYKSPDAGRTLLVENASFPCARRSSPARNYREVNTKQNITSTPLCSPHFDCYKPHKITKDSSSCSVGLGGHREIVSYICDVLDKQVTSDDIDSPSPRENHSYPRCRPRFNQGKENKGKCADILPVKCAVNLGPESCGSMSRRSYGTKPYSNNVLVEKLKRYLRSLKAPSKKIVSDRVCERKQNSWPWNVCSAVASPAKQPCMSTKMSSFNKYNESDSKGTGLLYRSGKIKSSLDSKNTSNVVCKCYKRADRCTTQPFPTSVNSGLLCACGLTEINDNTPKTGPKRICTGERKKRGCDSIDPKRLTTDGDVNAAQFRYQYGKYRIVVGTRHVNKNKEAFANEYSKNSVTAKKKNCADPKDPRLSPLISIRYKTKNSDDNTTTRHVDEKGGTLISGTKMTELEDNINDKIAKVIEQTLALKKELAKIPARKRSRCDT